MDYIPWLILQPATAERRTMKASDLHLRLKRLAMQEVR
jgi:hypothetical protein